MDLEHKIDAEHGKQPTAWPPERIRCELAHGPDPSEKDTQVRGRRFYDAIAVRAWTHPGLSQRNLRTDDTESTAEHLSIDDIKRITNAIAKIHHTVTAVEFPGRPKRWQIACHIASPTSYSTSPRARSRIAFAGWLTG